MPTPPGSSGVEIGEKVMAAPYEITIRKVVLGRRAAERLPAREGRPLAGDHRDRAQHARDVAVRRRRAQGRAGAQRRRRPGREARDAARDRVESTYRKVIADTSDLSPVQPGIAYDDGLPLRAAARRGAAVRGERAGRRAHLAGELDRQDDGLVRPRGGRAGDAADGRVRAAGEAKRPRRRRPRRRKDQAEAWRRLRRRPDGGHGGTSAAAPRPPGVDA